MPRPAFPILTYARTETRYFVGSDTRWQAFRPDEDVDINAMSGGGFNVGFIEVGESMRYTVDVKKKSEPQIERPPI